MGWIGHLADSSLVAHQVARPFLSYQVMPLVARGRLRIVLAEFQEPPLPLSIVYPHARLLPSRTRLFVDWMEKELRAAL